MRSLGVFKSYKILKSKFYEIIIETETDGDGKI